MASKPILYSYFRSSCTWRVRFAMALKGIDYDIRPLNILENERMSDWYAEINPMRQVPAIIIDGHTLTQSVSILEYLEETRPEPTLLASRDPFVRAQIREICETIGSGIQPLQNPSVYNEIGDETQRKEFVIKYISKGLAAVEQLLSKTASKYCVGDVVTLADCFLAPQVYNANRHSIDMSKYPIINRVMEYIVTLEAYQASHPDGQPDSPKNLQKA